MLRACAALLITLSGLTACAGSDPSAVVATVAGRPITRAALERWTSVQAAAGSQGRSGRTPQQRALGFLISSQWTMAEGAQLGVRVSETQAERELERFKYMQVEQLKYEPVPNEAQLRDALSNGRETHSDQVQLMRLNMLGAGIEAERLSQLQRRVTPAQIAAYYAQNRRLFFVPEQREIEIIMTYKLAKTEQAKREIESGKPFLSVARRVNVDPAAPEAVEHLVRGQGEKILLKNVFAAKPHVLSGPFPQALDYYILEVTGVTPATYRSQAQVANTIARSLASAQLHKDTAALAVARERTWRARTSCRPGYVVAECRQYGGPRPATPAVASSAG